MEAKPRPIKLEAHVLAYLGDFMNLFEESVRRQILKEINTPSASGLNPASIVNKEKK